ncbi:hypothetical protein HanRHA438_Chr07g0296831 [Helianthus annuus]|nr:hypothetical protein HanRHA438_Chr07g0296831 [Helianthus annuus]
MHGISVSHGIGRVTFIRNHATINISNSFHTELEIGRELISYELKFFYFIRSSSRTLRLRHVD